MHLSGRPSHLVIGAAQEAGNELVPRTCYERIVRVDRPDGLGTAFTLDRAGRQWLITARHVVDGVDPADLTLSVQGRNVSVQMEPIAGIPAGVDIAVFRLAAAITDDTPLSPGALGDVYITQDAYFLGFPFGLGFNAGQVTWPFVKRAMISGRVDDPSAGTRTWFLDGMNNPGFSGGPVVYNKVGTSDWHVAAVIHGYQIHQVPVTDQTGIAHAEAGQVALNSGLVVAPDIGPVVSAIDAAS